MGCFSFLCPCFGESSSRQDTRAQKQAKESLQLIVKGYREVAKFDLPAGAASVIADVRRNIIELENIMRDVKMPKARQWLLPLPQEQTDWEVVYPDGGFLLRRQMCMGSIGDDEWIVGCLFISDFGIAFDSGPITGESITFETGFVPWRDISSLSHVQPAAGKPKGLVTASVGGGRKFSTLKLQLSIQSDVEWLLEFWKRRHGKAVPETGGNDELWNIPDTDEGVRIPPPTMEARLMSPSGMSKEGPPPSAQPANLEGTAPRVERTKSILGEKKRRSTAQNVVTRTWSENLSSMFADTPKGTPSAEAPKEAPTNVEKHDALSKQVVVKSLENEDCLLRFVREHLKGTEVSGVPWSKSRRVDNTLVRKITFRMKLPDDVPRVVKRLISIPETTTVTMLYRLRTDATGAVLTYQTCTHDVTFGENFRVQETLAFLPMPSGGVEVKRWAEVVWVAPLPWAMGAIKSYIEEKAKVDGMKGVSALTRIIGELS